MSDWFASGRAIDLVLAVLALEALLFLFLTRGTRRRDLLLALVPGLFLLLALRASLTGAPWQVIAALVALSLPAHLLDIGRRIRKSNIHGS